MSKINFPEESVLAIDVQKRKLEVPFIIDLKKIFTDIANDASIIYRGTGTISARQLAENYEPEFLKEIRDAYRKAIKTFGFERRKTIEKKYNLLFNAQKKSDLFDFITSNGLNIKQIIEIEDEDLDEKVNQINTQFLFDSTFFIANESERQNEIITQTNTTMITTAIAGGIFAFTTQQSQRQEEINNLESRLVSIDDPKKRTAIARQIDQVNIQMTNANNNRQAIVADNIRTNLLDKREARSTIIAGQNIGLATAWSRQQEADLIDEASFIVEGNQQLIVFKEWTPLLDIRTRPAHRSANGQTVRVSEAFSIGGEALQYPLDPKGSAANIMNCRCILLYFTRLIKISS